MNDLRLLYFRGVQEWLESAQKPRAHVHLMRQLFHDLGQGDLPKYSFFGSEKREFCCNSEVGCVRLWKATSDRVVMHEMVHRA